MELTEAPPVHKATEHICKLYQRFYTQTIYPKVMRNVYATPPSLFMPSAPPWHCVYLRPLRVSVCPLYKPFNLSLHISKEPLITLLLCLLLSFYHVLNTLLPCLLLPCLMSSITLLPCLPLLCLMFSITLSPSRNAKPQKRVDKLIIPRSHTPQNN